MKTAYRRLRPTATINITPYIDILLVLLIIFMVIQPTTQFQLPARSPAKASDDESARAVQSPNIIVVSIDEEFRLSINSQPVSFPDLGRTLFDILNTRADRRIYIKGPADLPFGDVVRIIDVAKGAGAGDIGLI